jgi:zinc protease
MPGTMPCPAHPPRLRPALWLLVGAAVWLGGSGGAQGAGLFDIQSITDTRLDNGLHVVVSPDDWADVVAINVVVRAGAANEWGGRRGVAHFMEHMIFKGTPTRGVGEIEREIESLGGRINAGTLRDFSHFYVVVASPFFDEALDVLADAVLHPAFPVEEVERERTVILAETTRLLDMPEALLWRRAFAEALPNHAYGAPISGSLDEIRGMQREDLVRFHRTWYVAGNMAVIVVGNVDPETAFKAIRRRFGEAPAGNAPALRMPSQPALSGVRTAVEERATDRAYLLMAFQAPGLVTEPGDVLAMDLAMAILGEGYTSRLRRDLQESLPYVHRVSADFLTQREPGLAGVWAICDPQRTAETQAALQAAMEGLRARPVSDSELAKAKRVVARNFAFSNETYAERAETLGFYEALIGYRFACSYLRSVERLTARDVSRVAQKYLDPRRCIWVTIRPPQGGGAQ